MVPAKRKGRKVSNLNELVPEWDAEKGEITNVPEANAFITKTYRPGWELGKLG